MIELKKGDLLTEDAEAVVNAVNCVGVMGRGIALQFKNAFPENFRAYQKACKNGDVQPGRLFVFPTEKLTNPKFIINFPTKRHWRAKSRLEDIESGLEALVKVVDENNIKTLAIPPLGSGLGGLSWSTVKSRIEKTFQPLPNIRVIIFEPLKPTPLEIKSNQNRKRPGMTSGRAALIELIRLYLGGLMDPFVTLLEIHKLMYFMQEAGQVLNLKFKKAHYGPYAENLRHVLNAINGHFIAGFEDGGETPTKEIHLLPGASEEARKFLEQTPETQERFNRVSKLVEGFETPSSLALLATVHWVVKKESRVGEGQVIEAVHQWNTRKKGFTPNQIKIALSTLGTKSWI